MPIPLTVAEIVEAFPTYRVGVVVAEDLRIAPERPDALGALIRAREGAARARWGGMELARIPGIAAWREAYRGFGIKQTRYRSSVERLIKNTLAGRDLPRVNTFVDLYNAVSLAHVLPLGADDLDEVAPPFAFRYARPDDSFVDMADAASEGETAEPEAPKPGEVVYADATKVLCRRWNWRQDARSLIRPQTARAIVTVQANGWGDVTTATADLADLIGRFCGGRCRIEIADGAHHTVNL